MASWDNEDSWDCGNESWDTTPPTFESTVAFPNEDFLPNTSPISKPTLLDRLAIKHNALRHKSVLEYLTNTVMDCMDNKASLVVDGFPRRILNCVLDYVIMKRVERATGVCTILDYTNSMSNDIKALEIMEINCDINLVRKVVLAQLRNTTLCDYNSLSKSCVLISYTAAGSRVPYLPSFDGPFISISPGRISEENLTKVSRPLLRINYVEVSNKIVCTPLNGLYMNEYNTAFELSKDSIAGNMFPNPPSERDQFNSTENPLTRLTQKFNCDLKFISEVWSTLSDFLEKGDSVIVDNFSDTQLACLLDFVIAYRISNARRSKTLICCDNILYSTLSLLEVLKSDQFSVVYPNSTFDSNKKVLFLDGKEGWCFYQNLNTCMNLDNSYLLVKFSNQTGQLNLMFSHTNCQILCLAVTSVEQSVQSLILKPYINIRHTKGNEFEVNDFRYQAPSPSSVLNKIETNIPIYHSECYETHSEDYGYEEPPPHSLKSSETNCSQADPVPKHTLSDELFNRLVIKHNAMRYRSVLERLINIVMDSMYNKASVAVDGFDISVLTCLLDYVIIKRTSNATELCTVVKHSNSVSKEIDTLDIVNTKDYAKVENKINYSTKVLFLLFKNSFSHLVTTLPKDCLFVNYAKSSSNFYYLSMASCPFLSLATLKSNESRLCRIDRPFLHVRNEELGNDIVCIPRNEIDNNVLCNPRGPQVYNIEIKYEDVLPFPPESESADSVDLFESEQPLTSPSEMFSSNSDSLLPRLTNKYNCDLESTSNLCTTVTDFLHQGKSVIVDNFPLKQLACLLDFVIAYRITNCSSKKVLLYCYKKAFKSELQYLDIVQCNQYQVIDASLSIHPDTTVLIWHFETKSFYTQLNTHLGLDESYLLVKLSRWGDNLQLPFSLTNCQVLGLSENIMKKYNIKNILRQFISIRHTSRNEFEITDSDILKLKDNNCDLESERFQYKCEETTQQNSTFHKEINKLFLHKQNPVADLITQLFGKYSIKPLTDLPSDIYNAIFTLLLERSNVSVDGLSVSYVSQLVSIYALECKSLDTPVSICYARNTILLPDQFICIPIIPIESIVQTLTSNTDTNHLWLFIGMDNTTISQMIPLINVSHQCVFLFSHGFPFLLEKAHIPITRLYWQFDCINIRSYNEQLINLFSENVGNGLRDLTTAECCVPTQTQYDVSVGMVPGIGTETPTQQESNNQESLLNFQSTKELIIPIETVDNSISVKIDIDNVSLSFIETFNPYSEDKPLLSEFVTESAHIELNVDLTNSQSYPNIPIPVSYRDCDVESSLLPFSNSNEIENNIEIEVPLPKHNLTTELLPTENVTKSIHENTLCLTGINENSIAPFPLTDTRTDSNANPISTEDTISELESMKSYNTNTPASTLNGNVLSQSEHTVITDIPKQNQLLTIDMITDKVSNEISELYYSIEMPIILPDRKVPEFNSLLVPDLSTSPVNETDTGIQSDTRDIRTELTNTQPISIFANTNVSTETEHDTDTSQQNQLLTIDMITDKVSNEISELYYPIEMPIILPDSKIPEFNSLLVHDLSTSPVNETDTGVQSDTRDIRTELTNTQPISIFANTNVSTETEHDTDTSQQNQLLTIDMITDKVSNEISDLYYPIEMPIILPDSKVPEFNSLLVPDLSTSPVNETDTGIQSDTRDIRTELTNTQPISIFANTNVSTETEHDTDTSQQNQLFTIDMITDKVSNEISDLYYPIEMPIILPDSKVPEFNSLLVPDLSTSPVNETDTGIQSDTRDNSTELSKVESINSPITNTQPISTFANTNVSTGTEHDTDMSQQKAPSLLATECIAESNEISPPSTETPLPDSAVAESDLIPSPGKEIYTETAVITEVINTENNLIPELESITSPSTNADNTNIVIKPEINSETSEEISHNHFITTDLITEQVSNEISELYFPPTLPTSLPDACSIPCSDLIPSELGLHLITSPLQSGMHTIIFSTGSLYHTQILCHVASVLDCMSHSLQVVLTSQSPEICSQLLSIASKHLRSGTHGFLYKTGPLDQLTNFIVKQKVHILSIPILPLVSLIQSAASLFTDNKILVYVQDNTTAIIDTPSFEVLRRNMAKQFIFILPDENSCPPILQLFPTPNCEIKYHPFSTEIERYIVEFNFASV